MSSRPEILFPLFADIKTLSGIGPRLATLLEQMHVERPRDLLMSLPHNVIDRTERQTLKGCGDGEVVTVTARVLDHTPNTVKSRPYRVTLEDSEVEFELVFFHARGDWLTRTLPVGEERIISGKVEIFDGSYQIVHPDHVLAAEERGTIPRIEPVYPLTAGVTQKTMFKATTSLLAKLPKLAEWIEPSVMGKHDWPDWGSAMQSAHRPENVSDISPNAPARLRLAYDEFLAHQLTLALARARTKKAKGTASLGTGALQDRVIGGLAYTLTAAQLRSIAEIAADMASAHRMNRLLQGDVGAGKTVVALMALLVAVESGGQGVMMAPTEILARQHFENLSVMADLAGIRVEILTGRDKGKERAEKLADLASGAIDILLGTHAVFQKDVEFHDLRLAITDEQHRFGVRQRLDLSSKGQSVDALVMTATPIPRSLALANYGDMDVSLLDEKPPGRKPIKTVVMPTARIDALASHLADAIAEGRQAYWVCPLVEESELVDWMAAEERFKRLRAKLGDGVVDLVHGQMPTADKDAAMARF